MLIILEEIIFLSWYCVFFYFSYRKFSNYQALFSP